MEQVETGGSSFLWWTWATQLDGVSWWWSALGDWRVLSARGTPVRSPLGINQTTSPDGCNAKQTCEPVFGEGGSPCTPVDGDTGVTLDPTCGPAKKTGVCRLVCIASSDKLGSGSAS